jgi:hypothetical protein
MHGKGVSKVERLWLPLEELLQSGAQVGRRVDTEDLAGVRVIPAREEGHLEPLVALLRIRHILRVILMGFVVHLLDHLHQAAKPGCCICQVRWRRR